MARSRDRAVKTAEQAESGDLGPEPHAAVATPLSPRREWRSTRKHCGIPQPFLSVGQCELPSVGGCKEPEAGRLSLPILRQQKQEEEALVQLPDDNVLSHYHVDGLHSIPGLFRNLPLGTEESVSSLIRSSMVFSARGQTNSTVRRGTSKIAGETKQAASLSRPGPVGLSQRLPFLLCVGPAVCMLDHKPARTWKIRNQDCPCGLNVKIN